MVLDDLSAEQIATLADAVSRQGKIADGYLKIRLEPAIKTILEELLIPTRYETVTCRLKHIMHSLPALVLTKT